MTKDIIIGYPHTETVSAAFTSCLADTYRKMPEVKAVIPAKSSRQEASRNDIIERFLNTSAEYLWFIDTDMTWEAETAMAWAAQRYEHPMMAGLAFVYKSNERVILPNAFNFIGGEYRYFVTYPSDRGFYVDATGSAFTMVHRSIYEAVGYPWHETLMGERDLGHDLYFFEKAQAATGHRVWYDSRMKTGHIKEFSADEAMFRTFLAGVLFDPNSGFTINPELGRFLEAAINEYKPRLILELGSGQSTALLRNAASKCGAEVASIEESEFLAEANDAIWCPLEESWYSGVEDALGSTKFDFCLVDGPSPSGDRSLSLSKIDPYLAPGCVIVVDDYGRPDVMGALEEYEYEDRRDYPDGRFTVLRKRIT